MESYTYSTTSTDNSEDSDPNNDEMRDDVCCDPSHPCCTPADPTCRRTDPYCRQQIGPSFAEQRPPTKSSHSTTPSHHHHQQQQQQQQPQSHYQKPAETQKSYHSHHQPKESHHSSSPEKKHTEGQKSHHSASSGKDGRRTPPGSHHAASGGGSHHHPIGKDGRRTPPGRHHITLEPQTSSGYRNQQSENKNQSGHYQTNNPKCGTGIPYYNNPPQTNGGYQSEPDDRVGRTQPTSSEERSSSLEPKRSSQEPVTSSQPMADTSNGDGPGAESKTGESMEDHRPKHQAKVRLTSTGGRKGDRSSSNNYSISAPYNNVSDTSYKPDDPSCNPDHPTVVTFEEITSAAYKIRTGIVNTPCSISHMSHLTGMDIYLKKDFLQNTGSFKERGARYAMLMLSPEKKQKGVIAASLGNHAQAVCYHGKLLGIPVTVVMPIIAPIMKMQKCKEFNATVIMEGKDMAEAKKIAIRLAKERDLTYINGYDHPQIIAGQGTIALEIMEQVDDIDAVVVPTGGGGLLAGVAVAVKTLNPNIKIIGVESERCASFAKAMEAEKPVFTTIEGTLADGLAVPMVGYNAWETAKNLVDKVVVVKEEWIAVAILRLVELEKCVVEGAGAVGLAAILAGQLDEFKGKRVVLILSGGNIDTTILGRCLERGLAADGRLVKCKVTVSDRPGGISELCKLIGSIGVSIKDVIHERAWVASDVFSVEVKVVCETRDYAHSLELRDLLFSRYKKVKFDNLPQNIMAASDTEEEQNMNHNKSDSDN